MISFLRAAAIRIFDRFPGLLRAAQATWEPVLRAALLPFRRPKRRGRAVEDGATVARAADYNRAAERYFADHPEPWLLLTKPFSDPTLLARCLIDAGALIAGARLQPGDTVVEIGAGSCWLSHLLNRYGCRTIAVDVSPTVLHLGRQRFERDPSTNWSLEPRFLPYDGHRLPLDDGSCDRVVLYDAFHHIPNQRELLAEMHRILVPDGVVAMSEPGPGTRIEPDQRCRDPPLGGTGERARRRRPRRARGGGRLPRGERAGGRTDEALRGCRPAASDGSGAASVSGATGPSSVTS